MKRFYLILAGLLAILMLVSFVAAQSNSILWDPLGVPISEVPGYQIRPAIVRDDSSGAIIMWRDGRSRPSDPDGSDVYAQRVDQDGNILWSANGQPINVDPQATGYWTYGATPLAQDGQGGAVATWVNFDGQGGKVYAQRFDHLGNLLWGQSGVLIATSRADMSAPQMDPSIASDGSGGAFVTWANIPGYAGNAEDIYVQRVDASGAIQWGPEGVTVATSGNVSRFLPSVVHDGLGGAIVVWSDGRDVPAVRIYAQRVNSSSEAQWAAGGIPISQSTGQAYHLQHGLISDENGGTFIIWHHWDYFNGIGLLQAQHVRNDGTFLWGPQGVILRAEMSSRVYELQTATDSTGILAVWQDRRTPSPSIYAQKIDFSGNVLWSENGVPVSTAPGWKRLPSIVSDGEGGAIIAWRDQRNQLPKPAPRVSDVYAQHLDDSGMPLWTVDGELIEVQEGRQDLVVLTSDGQGGGIVAWDANTSSEAVDWNIYAQRIGPVNNPPTANAGGPYSVDEGGSVTVTASGSDPDGDPLTYAWDLDNDGTFETPGQSVTFSAAELDGPNSHTIAVQVTDSGGLSAADQTSVEVLNVAPTAIFTNTTGAIVQGETATLAFSNQFDPGVDDTVAGFLYSYDCTDDGTFELTDASATSFVCDYPDSGTFTARGRIKDKDGGFTDYTVEVSVLTPEEAIQDLIDTVESFNLQQGIENSLDAKLDAALQALEDLNDNNDVAAINALEAFINAVEAQRGNKLTDAQADELVEKAQAIISSLS